VILVDTCGLLDLFTADPQWLSWSKAQLEAHASQGLGISDIAFAELSPVFSSAEEGSGVLKRMNISLLRPSPEALFLAGRAFLRYRQNRGSARMILPDFLIGAQAEAENLSLLTRDCARCQSYFPSVRLLCP
jgi:hypothetical protein